MTADTVLEELLLTLIAKVEDNSAYMQIRMDQLEESVAKTSNPLTHLKPCKSNSLIQEASFLYEMLSREMKYSCREAVPFQFVIHYPANRDLLLRNGFKLWPDNMNVNGYFIGW